MHRVTGISDIQFSVWNLTNTILEQCAYVSRMVLRTHYSIVESYAMLHAKDDT